MAAGDRSAFALFYDLHSPRVLGLLVRKLAAIEPTLRMCCKKPFHQLWRSAARYSSQRSSPEVWVMLVVAAPRLLDFPSRRGAGQTRAVQLQQTAARRLTPGPALARDEANNGACMAPGALPAEQRAAISLAFLGGLTHREVAAQQAIPLGTAKTRASLLGIRSLRPNPVIAKKGPPT